MKKILTSLLVIITCFTLVGCSNKKQEEKEEKQSDDITMTIKEGTLTRTSATVIITETGNKRYAYGKPFRIDRKVNDKWEELKMPDNFGFILPAYYTDKNRQLELEHNWLYMYGELKNGEYRLVKDVCINDGCKEEKEFYVEFVINDEIDSSVVINEVDQDVKEKIIDTTKIEVCIESTEENKEDTILKTITEEQEVNRIVSLLYHVKKDTRTVAGIGTSYYLVLYNSKNQQLSKIYIGADYITVDEKNYLRDNTFLLRLFEE